MKRLIKQSSINLYHGTSFEYLPNIASQGLLPGSEFGDRGGWTDAHGGEESVKNSQGLIFLTNNLDDASSWACGGNVRGDTDPVIVLEINIDESKLLPDFNDCPNAKDWKESLSKCNQVSYNGSIPPNQIIKIYFYNQWSGELICDAKTNNWEQIYEKNKEKFDDGDNL